VHADVDTIIKRDDVARTHANATEAGGSAKGAFFWCAMDVNATIVRRQVLSFHTAQPNHARDNSVSIRRIDGEDFASGRGFFYYCANR
jgi:hypothetical protein